MYRQGKLGAIQKLEEIATRHRLQIRVLTPLNDSIKQLAYELGKYADIRYIPEELRTQLTTCVFDRKFSLVVETKDDSKNSSNEAFGLATYSNSASTVLSYVSIFETLWKQSGMYEESQIQLHSAEAEMDRMKQYLNEVLNEVASFRQSRHRIGLERKYFNSKNSTHIRTREYNQYHIAGSI